jgi:7,8-dihydropterin-6-yl-methyl-4-(beta-D-ribofuranosyl)aminobenzene 5'-phosphate synthase
MRSDRAADSDKSTVGIDNEMKITIIYDNETCNEVLKADWGFSCLVEAYGRKILFDTGAKGSLLLENMKALKIDPHEVNEVFISHDHWDHTGGLSAFLKENSNVIVYAPSTLQRIDNARKVVCVDEPVELQEHFYSTGLLKDIEQCLVVETEKGLVVIVGCSHPGVRVILDAATQRGAPRAVIGGLHGFDDYELIRKLRFVCPTHCTQHIPEIQSLYPDKYIQGGAGKVIEI